MKTVTVIPLKKGPIGSDLTYFTTKEVSVGNIVSIPFRTKQILGLVISVENVRDDKMSIKGMDFNLRKIIEVKENSIFSKEYLDSAMEIAKYFVATKNNTVASLIPSIFREKYDEINLNKKENQEIQREEKKEVKKIKAEKVLFQAPLAERIDSYKTLIRESFASKKSILMVLPTEYDIKKFYEVLSHGVEKFTFVLHGKLNSKKIMENLGKILSDPHPVLVLSTTPFLSIIRKDTGVIILEHESSTAYKMITKPYIDNRAFIELYASKINVKLILSDTLMRFETIAKNKTGEFASMHPMSFRINFEGEIKISTKEKKFSIFTEESIEAIKNKLEKKESIFIFSLRKGLATYTVCKDCNQTVNCENCLTPVVLYISRDGKKRIFSCNRCKKELDPDTACGNCGSWNLMPLGIGTDTVFEEVKRLFPKTSVFKLDKDIAKSSKDAEKIIKNFEDYTGGILVGTEMTFSYLKEKVSLSIISSFETLWSIPNFKMSEKILQIVLSIIERTQKKVIIQTKNENDPAILAIKNLNLAPFVTEELQDRFTLGYPPFKRFIKITHLGNKEQTTKARMFLEENFREYAPEIFSGFVAKLKDTYNTNALIKLDPKKWSLASSLDLSNIDEELYDKLRDLPPPFEVTIDPEDLL